MTSEETGEERGKPYLLEESLSATKNMFQLGKFQEGLFHLFDIEIDIPQFIFKFIQICFEIKHFSGWRGFWNFLGLDNGESVLVEFTFNIAYNIIYNSSRLRSFLSISSQRLTSSTNFR